MHPVILSPNNGHTIFGGNFPRFNLDHPVTNAPNSKSKMPGPSNARKKPRKSSGKHHKNRKPSSSKPPHSSNNDARRSDASFVPLSRSPSPTSPSQPITPASPVEFYSLRVKEAQTKVTPLCEAFPRPDITLPQEPFIYDPGNGPRVRSTGAFLASFFAQKPALHDPMCAEFAQEEVLQMLKTVLPDETATVRGFKYSNASLYSLQILWYNKSRATSRICPACQRLYRLGDILPDHIDGELVNTKHSRTPPQLEREQEISGLCTYIPVLLHSINPDKLVAGSPVCFILASFNHPGVIKSAWGAMANEMDETAWQQLNGPGEANTQSDVSTGLNMLVRMTRLHDLGLGQLCFPDVDFAGLE